MNDPVLVRYFHGNNDMEIKVIEKSTLPEGAISSGPGLDGREEFLVGPPGDIARFKTAMDAVKQLTGK